MCTSVISNRNKTIVGWNLDILEMCLRLYPDKKADFLKNPSIK